MDPVRKALSLSPKIIFHQNSIVYPISEFDLQKRTFDGGVLTKEKQHCLLSVQKKSGYLNIGPNQQFEVKAKKSGFYLYGGMLQNEHFGHFLIESLTRLWPIPNISGIDGIAFILRSNNIKVARFVYDFFSLLLPNSSILIVKEVTEFERLCVPEQICIETQGVLINHSAFESLFLDFKNKISAHSAGQVYPKKIFVSRSRLTGNEGGILLESHLDNLLRDEGYYIMHPQELSIQEQLSFYLNAEKIIFSDGSAYHLYVLVSSKRQDIFVIWRRKKPFDFDNQLFTFIGKFSKGKPALSGYFTPKNENHISSRQKAKLDYVELGKQLQKDNFIIGNNWHEPSEKLLNLEIKNIEIKTNREMEFVEGINK